MSEAEFMLLSPPTRGPQRKHLLRQATLDDELYLRHCTLTDESSKRVALFDAMNWDSLHRQAHEPHVATNEVPIYYGTTTEVARRLGLGADFPDSPLHLDAIWKMNTARSFANKVEQQAESVAHVYTETSLSWVPQDSCSMLYTEFRAYYSKWTSRKTFAQGAVASALVPSFLCKILVDDAIEDEAAIQLSKVLLEESIQVTSDDADCVTEAIPYRSFVLLLRNIASRVFPARHPMSAMTLLVGALEERVHRIHF